MRTFLVRSLAAATLALTAVAQGPVVLMGIDAEDCGPGGHGPITVYRSVVDSLLGAVTKAGTTQDILVVGGTAQCVDPFWNALVAINPPLNYTRINGAAIASTSLDAYRLVVVASDFLNTPGGLNEAENTTLSTRAGDIATHVNVGGGLLGFSSCALNNPYGYFSAIGPIVCGNVFESNITPTPEGTAIGISNALDVCCWHDSYVTFPSFLDVLATYPNVSNAPAALGGVDVVVPGFSLTPGSAVNPVGTNHTVTITVSQATGGGAPVPVPGVTVDFVVTGVNPASGQCTTDINGQCNFMWFGANPGSDVVTASATVAGQPQSTFATKEWFDATLTCPPDFTEIWNGGIAAGQADPLNTGTATFSTSCPTGGGALSYSDISVVTNTPQNPHAPEAIITRRWTLTDNCGTNLSCDQTITFLSPSGQTGSLTLDIAPGQCPNTLAVTGGAFSTGSTSIAVTGTWLHNVVNNVDRKSLTLERVDGAGSIVRVGKSALFFHDVTRPYYGPLGGCQSLGGEFYTDARLVIPNRVLARGLDLVSLPAGAQVQIRLRGALLDGTPIDVTDFVRIQ